MSTTAATDTTGPARELATGVPRIPFGRLVAVELRKATDTRAGLWLASAIVLVTAAAIAIFFVTAESGDRVFENFLGFAAAPQGFLLPVLGILLVTSEWSQRTAMVTFALAPSRSTVVAAKTVAALVLGVAAYAAALGVAALATLLGGMPDGAFDLPAAAFALFFALQLFSLLQGLAYGMLLLNTPAAVVAFFVLPTVSSIVFTSFSALRDAAPWIDLGTAQQMLFSGDFALSGEQYAQLGTTALIWIVVPFVLGWVRLMRAELK